MTVNTGFRPELLTLDEAAQFLQMSPTQLQELARVRAIQAADRDSRGGYYFTHRAIIAWSTQRLRLPSPAA